MTIELPPGFHAWSRDGRPVRRVATNGNPPVLAADVGRVIFEKTGFDPQELVKRLSELTTDVVVYGDAWLDFDGERVHPTDVVIEREQPG
jgi:hypothetical protein